mmetsp:Transcript_15797/g.24259  ORF Transcript_15797/g.24259 Transcript_15797/m.24259 type:complete len:246 (+) Transcript_15797:333-1070(+)
MSALHQHLETNDHDIGGEELSAPHRESAIVRAPHIQIVAIHQNGSRKPRSTLPQRRKHPKRKRAKSEARVELEQRVGCRVVHGSRGSNVLFEGAHAEWEQRSEEQIEGGHEVGIKARLRGEQRVCAIIAHCQHKRHILVERDERQLRGAQKRVSTMHKQQALQVRKTMNDKVCGQRCLCAFLAHDTDTHIRCLNHAHIIGTVANRQRDTIQVVLHHRHQHCFLCGIATITNERRATLKQAHKIGQ